MEQFSFENLETYNQAMRLVKMTHDLAEKFPNHEKYGLYNQIHRAIVSIPSNITVDEFLAIKPQFFTVSRLMNALNNSYVKQIETNHKPLNP